MRFISKQTIKLLSLSISVVILLYFCWSYNQTQVLASAQQITVDVNNVLADVANNPLGMNLNFLLDNENVVEPAQEIGIGSLRYPMGEIADYYLFDRNNPTKPKISIRDSSIWFSRFTDADGIWKNALNFDEFVNICRSLNAEPFVVVGIDALAYTKNSPHATSEEVLQAAIDWVEYANITQKYQIKYWEIGNETDLSSAHVNWTAKDYANTVVKFSQAMKKVDPSIQIGVNGMTGSAWWDQVMPIVRSDVDFLVTHQYSSMHSYEQWQSNTWKYKYNVEIAQQAIEKYNPKIKLNITEVSAFNPATSHFNNIWKMLHNFEILGNILCVDQVEYLHFWISSWFTSNSYSIDASIFNNNYDLMPIAYALKVWGDFLKQQMVYSTPQVDKIRSWASYDPQDHSLVLFLLNKDKYSHKVNINLDNYQANTNVQKWLLSGESQSTTNPGWQKVTSSEKFKHSKMYLQLQPLSVTVVAFEK